MFQVASPTALLEDCSELIKAEDVELLVSFHPGLDLVHAALLRSFPHLKGPSCESVFLCLHKAYNRQSLLGIFSLPYAVIDLDDVVREKVAVEMDNFGGQAYLRDCVGNSGSTMRRLKNERQFWKEFDKIKEEVTNNQNPYHAFFDNYIDRAKYPLAHQVLLEKYWEIVAKDINVHLVEACVSDGEFIPWIISDVAYSRSKPRCINTVSVPTKLDGFLQMQVWGVMREVVQRLTAQGFEHHFVNALVLTSDDGLVRVADVNSCIVRENTALYKHVFQSGDNMRAQLELLQGHMLRTPRLLDQKFACRCAITAFTEDVTLGDIMNIKEAKAQGHVDIMVPTSDSWRVKKSDFGTQISRFSVFGISEEDCDRQLKEVLTNILKEPKHTNWAEKDKENGI